VFFLSNEKALPYIEKAPPALMFSGRGAFLFKGQILLFKGF
jgi:hypothetical protein